MDEITLTLPRAEPYHGIAHLVLGGLAARLGFSVESLDDLQLALEGLLGAEAAAERVSVSLCVDGDELRARLGPFDETLERELELEGGSKLSLRRLLDTVVDRVELTEAAGGHWVELRKTVAASTAA
ncbi:MAG: hypothetical protein H0V40_05010 [Actinobacteria bacterium]|nr:hypothetical protein [Actinomycetota bacterium]